MASRVRALDRDRPRGCGALPRRGAALVVAFTRARECRTRLDPHRCARDGRGARGAFARDAAHQRVRSQRDDRADRPCRRASPLSRLAGRSPAGNRYLTRAVLFGWHVAPVFRRPDGGYRSSVAKNQAEEDQQTARRKTVRESDEDGKARESPPHKVETRRAPQSASHLEQAGQTERLKCPVARRTPTSSKSS